MIKISSDSSREDLSAIHQSLLKQNSYMRGYELEHLKPDELAILLSEKASFDLLATVTALSKRIQLKSILCNGFMTSFERGRVFHALKDYRLAEQCYKDAAIEGDARAALNLGILLHEDLEDHEAAIPFLLQAAEAGLKKAYVALVSVFTSLEDCEKVNFYGAEAAKNGYAGAVHPFLLRADLQEQYFAPDEASDSPYLVTNYDGLG